MKKFYKFLSIFYLIIITIALLTPIKSLTKISRVEAPADDKTSYLIHLIIFFILYLSLKISYSRNNLIIIFCALYAFVIEILQIFTDRGFSLGDIYFNLIGITISYFFLSYKKL